MRFVVIFLLYALSFVCLLGWYKMNGSTLWHQEVENLSKHRPDLGFALLSWYGVVKLALLMVGSSLPIILTAKIIRDRKRKG